MNVFKLALEHKKLSLLVLLIYAVCFIFVYNYYGKIYQALNSRQPLAIGALLAHFWNDKSLLDVGIDVHLENGLLGHTGEVSGDDTSHLASSGVTTIAIGLGITSKGVKGADQSNIAAKFQFFHLFLPTFCNTSSPQFVYRFYLAYDYTDPFYTNTLLSAAYKDTFTTETARMCTPNLINSTIHLVQCSHTGRPTRAQNDAMLEAYLDHVDYYYRVNDDTRMMTAGWAEAFIAALAGHSPPRVGVVGPRHSGGNTAILTYDFVHRTHVDLFGFYYPYMFSDWWGDGWITRVYRPDRSTKLGHIHLAHTLSLGQRYAIKDWSVGGKQAARVEQDKVLLNR
jgi:hypothetical protein